MGPEVDAKVLVNYLNNFKGAGRIRDYFLSIGVNGYRQEESACPIANWLSDRLGHYVVVEDKVSIYSYGDVDKPEEVFELSEHAKEFIDNFDCGRYPELDADYDPGWDEDRWGEQEPSSF